MSFYVYILKCSNGTFYTGSTTNLIERLNNHIFGDNPRAYTYRLRPVKLVWAEKYESKIDALIIEKQIRGWSHAKKQALIDDDFDQIHQIVKQERKKRES